jgi:glutathione S-transferase
MKQSPWTEKARWALDHHGVDYRYHEHVPLLGEVLLRAKLRRRRDGKPTSVPLLEDGRELFTSSLDIARHAERIGRGPTLFPKSLVPDIERWNALSDRMIGVGRVRVLMRVRTQPEVQREALPPFLPGIARAVLAPSSRLAARFLASKHSVAADLEGEVRTTLAPALEEVRRALAGRTYLVGDSLSYADVAIGAALRAVRPEARADIGPATRDAWSDDALAREFEDLLMWRDALYAKHR